MSITWLCRGWLEVHVESALKDGVHEGIWGRRRLADGRGKEAESVARQV